MEQPRNISLFPQISYARVVGYEWNNHAVYVDLPSQQQVSTLAKVLFVGEADAQRINQLPLPVIGTWGLVVGAFGDTTSLIWLGAIYMSQDNAVNTSGVPTFEDMAMQYTSHPSGAYELLDYHGNRFYRSPDGSILLMNSDNTSPKTYRHTTDPVTGIQQQLLFNDVDRNPNPPLPFYLAVKHPTGASITIAPDGAITIQQAKDSSDTLTTLWTLRNDGSILIDGQTNIPAIDKTNIQIQMQKSINLFQSDPNNPQITSDVQLTNGNISLEAFDTINMSSDNVDINSGNINIITPANGNILLTNSSCSIVVSSTGSISITTITGAVIEIGPGGFIHISSPLGIALNAPPNTITANGNVLG